MRRSACLLFLFVEALAYGQGFNKRYDAFDWGFAQTALGLERWGSHYLVTSVSYDYDSVAPGVSFGHSSVLNTTIDVDGNLVEQKRTWRIQHSAYAGWANCCDTIPGGGLIVGGSSEDTLGNDEVYLMRFDANGDTLWTRVFGDPNLNYYYIGRQVKRTPDGGFLIVGDMGINIQVNGMDAFALKTDSLGNEQWRRFYTWPPPRTEGLISCDMGPDHTYYLSGSTFPTDDNGQHWVLRIDTLGNEIWNVNWGGPYSEGATQMISATDGQPIVFGGHGYATAGTALRPYIAKLDSTDGSILWEHQYGPIAYSTLFFAGKEAPNGDLIAAGVSYANSGINNAQQGLLLRTTSTGDSLWMFNYYYQDDVITTGQGRFYDVLPTPDGGFIAAGAAYNPVGMGYPAGYSQDTWVVKVDGLGCIVPGCNTVGITEQATNLLDALKLFPNPVASGQPLTIQLDLPPSVANKPLQLSVLAVDGHVVHQQGLTGNGAHTVAMQDLATGVYFVHIATASRWLTGGKFLVE